MAEQIESKERTPTIQQARSYYTADGEYRISVKVAANYPLCLLRTPQLIKPFSDSHDLNTHTFPTVYTKYFCDAAESSVAGLEGLLREVRTVARL